MPTVWICNVQCQVLTPLLWRIQVFYDMTLCQSIKSYWCFQGACYHHFQGLWNPRAFLSMENVGIYQLTEHPIPKAITLKIFGTLIGSVYWTSASSISSNNTSIHDLILWDLQVNHRLVVFRYVLTLQGKLKDGTLKQFMTTYKTLPA